MGIQIFESVGEAINAGFMIESPIPDSEGFLHARIRTSAGWAKALVRMSRTSIAYRAA
jgi:hypothetical protein